MKILYEKQHKAIYGRPNYFQSKIDFKKKTLKPMK
jgi:hypothetical protein